MLLASSVRPLGSGSIWRDCASLACETVAMTILALAVAVLVAGLLGLGASERFVGSGRLGRWQWWIVQSQRTVLDLLRGVPDFVWAIIILTGPGPGAVTGLAALALHASGQLGKSYADLLDAGEPRLEEMARAAGAGRWQLLLYVWLPQAWPAMRSHTFLRFECGLRNATVIGVVGGGGLGARLFEELEYGHYDRVAALLATLVLVVMLWELVARRLQRRGPVRGPVRSGEQGPPRLFSRPSRRFAATLVVIVCAGLWLAPAFRRAALELSRIEWSWLADQGARLGALDLSVRTLSDALLGLALPLALAVFSLALAWVIALVQAYWGAQAQRLRGRLRPGRAVLYWVVATAWLSRSLALLNRAIPEVAWALVFAAALGMGPWPALAALVIHGSGVLARLFVESVEQQSPSEVGGHAFIAYCYSSVPPLWPIWSRYLVLQFESHLRAGLVLGVVGAGGIGDAFHTSFSHWQLERAGTLLVTMVLATMLIDRVTRRWLMRTRS